MTVWFCFWMITPPRSFPHARFPNQPCEPSFFVKIPVSFYILSILKIE